MHASAWAGDENALCWDRSYWQMRTLATLPSCRSAPPISIRDPGNETCSIPNPFRAPSELSVANTQSAWVQLATHAHPLLRQPARSDLVRPLACSWWTDMQTAVSEADVASYGHAASLVVRASAAGTSTGSSLQSHSDDHAWRRSLGGLLLSRFLLQQGQAAGAAKVIRPFLAPSLESTRASDRVAQGSKPSLHWAQGGRCRQVVEDLFAVRSAFATAASRVSHTNGATVQSLALASMQALSEMKQPATTAERMIAVGDALTAGLGIGHAMGLGASWAWAETSKDKQMPRSHVAASANGPLILGSVALGDDVPRGIQSYRAALMNIMDRGLPKGTPPSVLCACSACSGALHKLDNR